MSNVRARFLTDTATIWKKQVGLDSNGFGGQTSYIRAGSLNVNYRTDETLRVDSDGKEFLSKFIYRTQESQLPESVTTGDMIALGYYEDDFVPGDADEIRKIKSKTPLRGDKDITFYTL